MQELQQQQQQQMHQHHPQGLSGQRGMRPVGANNSMNPIHAEASRGGGSSTAPPETKAPSDVRGGNKQDAPEAGASGADGPGSSATGKGSGDAEAKWTLASLPSPTSLHVAVDSRPLTLGLVFIGFICDTKQGPREFLVGYLESR